MELLGIPNLMHIEIFRSALLNKNVTWRMRSGALIAGLKTDKSRYGYTCTLDMVIILFIFQCDCKIVKSNY